MFPYIRVDAENNVCSSCLYEIDALFTHPANPDT
jgi:hypothetical protein